MYNLSYVGADNSTHELYSCDKHLEVVSLEQKGLVEMEQFKERMQDFGKGHNIGISFNSV